SFGKGIVLSRPPLTLTRAVQRPWLQTSEETRRFRASLTRRLVRARVSSSAWGLFYERECQEKSFPLTWQPGFFSDSQPRENDLPDFQPSKRSKLPSHVPQRSIFHLLYLTVFVAIGNQCSICDSRPMVISGCPRGTIV